MIECATRPQRDRIEAHVTLATCTTARTACEDYVRTMPLHSLDRFYIPETGRQELEKWLRDAAVTGTAHLSVAVGQMGQPMIEGLWVDGEPISLAEPEQADSSDARATTAEPG